MTSDPRFLLRPFQDSDFEAASQIISRTHPSFPVTPEELRHWDRLADGPGIFKLRLTAEERVSGQVIATGIVFNPPWAFDRNRYWVDLDVDPSFQGRGVGRSLFGALEGRAVERGARTLGASVREDQNRSVGFFARAGFVERRRNWTSRLDLTRLEAEGQLRVRAGREIEGVEFTSVADEGPDDPEVQAKLYRLDRDASRDVPRMGPWTEPSFEHFRDLVLEGPGYFPEGILLAKVGREYVAYTYLIKQPNNPEVLQTGFTGTLPSYRRRGIAMELKRRAIDLARARGFRSLRTNNDSENLPMWSLNERLGFRVEETWIQGEKSLRD